MLSGRSARTFNVRTILVFALISSFDCAPAAHGVTPSPHAAHGAGARTRGRILPSTEHIAEPVQCKTDVDCGLRAHAKTTLCHHAGFCVTHCEEHWGDCNDDYRDGCERPIAHTRYCDDDPRIHQYFPASVDFDPLGMATGPGHLDSTVLVVELDRHRPELAACYERSLTAATHAEAELSYLITINESGGVATYHQTRATIDSKQLNDCVSLFFNQLSFVPAPKGGSVTCHYRMLFMPGSYSSDDSNE
ncbi:MAG: hypothetical protein RL701_3416 [Pseudomonadota bacterium]|jgi:hypothetical protein